MNLDNYPTPLTDSVLIFDDDGAPASCDGKEIVFADTARLLEQQLAACREALAQISELPGEVNLCNYNDDEVRLLNDSHIQAWQITTVALAATEPKP